MKVDNYLDNFIEAVQEEGSEGQELRDEYSEIYLEVASYFGEKVSEGELPQDVVVNMLFSLLVNQLAVMNKCPACEFFEASKIMHDKVGCPNVH